MRAQVEDDMGVDMPAGGDAGGGQARAVQGEGGAEAEVSGRRASGAGGAQGGAPQALRRSCCPWLGVFKLTSVGSLKVIWGLIS